MDSFNYQLQNQEAQRECDLIQQQYTKSDQKVPELVQKQESQPAVQFRGVKGYQAMEEACREMLSQRDQEDSWNTQPELLVASDGTMAAEIQECVRFDGNKFAVRFFTPANISTEQGIEMLKRASERGYKVNSFEEHPAIKRYAESALNSKEKEILSEITEDMELIAGDYRWSNGWTGILEDGHFKKLFKGRIIFKRIEKIYDKDGKIQLEKWVVRIESGRHHRNMESDARNAANELVKSMQATPGIKIESGAKIDIHNLLRCLAEDVPVTKVHLRSGWNRIDDSCKYRYLYDGRKGFACRSKQTICFLPEIKPLDVLEKMIAVFRDQYLAGPMILYSFLGPTAFLFKMAGHQPTVLLMVSGRTGSLKTATSRILYELFNTTNSPSLHSFQSTIAALEPAIEEAQDSTLLLDDFCPNSIGNKNIQANMVGVLDVLTRYYGDATSKRKSNREGQMVEMPRPCGGAVVTGEITTDLHSALLRMVVVELNAQSIEGENLSYFQANRDIYPSLIWEYIKYIEQKFDSIVNMIKEKYPLYRKMASIQLPIREGRSIDHYVEYKIIFEILRAFLSDNSDQLTADRLDQLEKMFLDGVLRNIRQTEQRASQIEPMAMTLIIIRNILDEAALADNSQEFIESSRFLGYHRGKNCIAICKSEFEKILQEELRKNKMPMPNMMSLKKKLSAADMSILQTFGNGNGYAAYTTKVQLKGYGAKVVYVMDYGALEIAISNFEHE